MNYHVNRLLVIGRGVASRTLRLFDRHSGRYWCPVCDSRNRRFIPLDGFYAAQKVKHGNPYSFDDMETLNYRQYSCPVCGASDRERLYALYLRQVLNKSGQRESIHLLDIAPSRALRTYISSQDNIIYRSADLCASEVDDKLDVTNMHHYSDDLYDAFICSHVLEHVADDREALKELFRVLKSGGWGILMVPINLSIEEIDEDPSVEDTAERWRRFGQGDHVRLYSRSGFLSRILETGFCVDELSVVDFGEQLFCRTGIAIRSVLYVVKKVG